MTSLAYSNTEYETTLFPMTPSGNDVILNPYGVPYEGHDHRAMINIRASNGISGDRRGQWNIVYSFEDLQDDLDGLEIAIHKERNDRLKELQAHKDLLDHVSYLTKTGEMTEQDLLDTQDTVHEEMKDKHNPYYRWFDLRSFPRTFTHNTKTGLTGTNSLCTYLRKTFRVWYVCFQGNRVVVMGNNQSELDKCMAELREELRIAAGGEWIDCLYGTTERYERILNRIDLELSNVDLISETWGTTYEETYEILKKETDEELDMENTVRHFALTGFINQSVDPLL